MRVQIISDVHTEFHKDNGRSFIESMDSTDVDVLIIAGDLGTHDTVSMNLRLFCKKYPHVIYVAGNHEYYGTSFEKFRRYMSRVECENLHYLDNNIVVIDGQKFVGTTLWFRDHPNNVVLAATMNDFWSIKNFGRDVYSENKKGIERLESEVDESCVVITHHLPAPKSIGSLYVGSPLNVFFLCDMSKLIWEKQPKLWVHGHTHDSFDYKMGKTRIVCNPFGYTGHAINPQYEDKKIVEV